MWREQSQRRVQKNSKSTITISTLFLTVMAGLEEYFPLTVRKQAEANSIRAKKVVSLYEEIKHSTIADIFKTKSAVKIQDFLFLKIMFETPGFTRASGLSKPHAARILEKLMQHGIVKTISPAKGRRAAIYSFS